MRNPSQIAHFARQLYPNRKGMLEEVYEDCMKTAYGYLVIDMSPHTDDGYRLRTHIFPDEHTTVYIPRRSEHPSLLKMSQLRKHSTFVYLLGETNSAAQKRALLKTITPGQFQALTLVLYNIIHLKVPSDSSFRKKLKRYKTPLTLITDRKVGKAKRLSTLKSNPTAVSLLIKSALQGLKTILLT